MIPESTSLSRNTPSAISQFGYHLTGLWLRLAQAIWVISLLLSLGIMASGFYALLAYPANQLLFASQAQPYSIRVNLFYITFLPPLQVFVMLVALVLSSLVFWRQRDDGVAILTSLTIMVFVGTLSLGVIDVNPWASAIREEAEVIAVSIALLSSSLTLLVFPNGRFVPRWTRWLALIWACWMGLQIFVRSLYIYNLPAPLWAALQFLMMGVGTGCQVYRYRHESSLTQRQQTRLIVYGTVLALALHTIYQLLTLGSSNPADAPAIFVTARLIYYAARLVLMLFFVLAVLRYRLWGIEFIVNRSLVYGLLSLGLAGLFVGVLYLVSLFVPAQATLVAIAITAGLAGLVFQPLRQRLQGLVDRALYNIQINYESRPLPDPAPTSLTPVRLADYQDLTLLGRGGIAEVYLAIHTESGDKVAIKILYGEALDSPEHRRRLTREAELMARLEHPNIAQVLGYGHIPDQPGRPYLVIEYLPGENLGQRLKTRGPLELAESLIILDQLTDALEYAHTQGVVHRDIKASNVMLVPDGTRERAVLMDFGLAKLLGSQSVMTRTGGVMGTFDYIAPEQIQSAANVDARADLYALGILTYQMLTGKLPFQHPHPGGLLIAHLTQPPSDPRQLRPELPTSTARAILKALAKKPDRRFSGVREFFSALQPNPS
ncbi:MAG: serine/threonine protein kinase [Chloroflexia bacterium]|nr:serine/threonine protein kinase [Chloroflexia bacterium]